MTQHSPLTSENSEITNAVIGNEYIEKEVDMGFFENYMTAVDKNGIYIQSGCVRISNCSCDCDDCLITGVL